MTAYVRTHSKRRSAPLAFTQLVFQLSELTDVAGMRQKVYCDRYRVVYLAAYWIRIYDHAQTPPVETDFEDKSSRAMKTRAMVVREMAAMWLLERGVS